MNGCPTPILAVPMAIRIVRLGSDRAPGEGLRIGTVRRPPRGVPKSDFARLDYYDTWLPQLAPSTALFTWARSEPWTDQRWREFARRYGAEMRSPDVQHTIALLAALSASADFSVGCYCDDAARCHRSLLADLLRSHGAKVAAVPKSADSPPRRPSRTSRIPRAAVK